MWLVFWVRNGVGWMYRLVVRRGGLGGTTVGRGGRTGAHTYMYVAACTRPSGRACVRAYVAEGAFQVPVLSSSGVRRCAETFFSTFI